MSCSPENVDGHIEKIERFAVKVSTSSIGGDESVNLEDDRCVLILPANYSEKASVKTRLVIYCHSGEGTV